MMFSKLLDSILKKDSSPASCKDTNGGPATSPDSSSAFSGAGAHSNFDDHNSSFTSSSTFVPSPKAGYRELPVEHVLKIVILGGTQVGKSSLIRRYLQECFTNSYIPTIGVDLSTLILEPLQASSANIEGSQQIQQISNLTSATMSNGYYYIQFIDVPQAEIRGKHVASIFNGVSGVVMMFDSTNASSIVSIDEWKNVLRRYNLDHRIPIALFANKSDLGDPVINSSDLENYCKACEYNFWKLTSARKDNGVKDGVEKLLDLILERRQQEADSKRRTTIVTIQTSDSKHSSMRLNKERMISQSMPTMMLGPNAHVPKSTSTGTAPISESPSSSSSNLLSPKKERGREISESGEPDDRSGASTDESSSSSSQDKETGDKSSGPVVVSSVQPERPKTQPSDILKLTELQNLATEFYGKVGKQLEDFLQHSMGSRYKDLSMLEKQRSHEYLKICNCLKKLIHPQLHLNGHHHSSRSKNITKEIVQSALEENIKKWNTLLENLQLESALDNQEVLSTSLKLDSGILSSSNLHSYASSTLSTISEDPNSQRLSNNNVNSTTTTTNNRLQYNSSRQISQSFSNFDNHRSSSHHHHKSGSGKWKMGFGFRNNGRNSSIQVPSSNYNLDTDNPVSSSSTMSSTSSSSSGSPLASPSTSPTNSLPISSPSILPSSYDLTAHNLPQPPLSSSLTNGNSFHELTHHS